MPGFKNRHILIVDDDEGVLRALSRFLKKTGYVVSEAVCGKDALEKMAQTKPDLVLLDVIMPEMDGIETLEKIRQKFPNTEVVMISAIKEEAVAKESIRNGAYEWLSKPFSMQHLEMTINVALLKKIAESDLEKQV